MKALLGHNAGLLRTLLGSASLVALSPLCSPEARAQTAYCVRSGATGANDGSDWTNAHASLPSTLKRGARYYVADGDYPPYRFDTPESGTSRVTIRKATTADHGTGTGWRSGYGDGQARFGPLAISRGHVEVDGVTGGGPGSWKSGHGFRIAADYARLIHFTAPVADVTVRHVECAFPTSEVGDSLSTDHIYGVHTVSDLTLEYCYLHDTSRVFILSRGWVDVCIQYNCFARNRSTAGKHAEAWSDHRGRRYVIRNNLWEDIEGTGVVVMLHGSAYDWDIHGNVVYWTGSPRYSGVGNGAFTTRSAEAYAYNWTVCSNTVVNGVGHNTFHFIYNGQNNVVKNNLWFNSRVSAGGAATIDSNWYIRSGSRDVGPNDVSHTTGADPFVDAAHGDFRLKAASPAGEDVTTAGKRFHIDPNMAVRGKDGVWDRGAFEFDGSTRAPR